MQFVIEGKPLAKARARIVRRGNFSIAYDPQQKEKEIFRDRIRQQINLTAEGADKEMRIELGKIACADAFSFDLDLYMPIPKSLSEKKKKALNGTYHNKKSDGDNIFKFVTDCSNGILYKDDSQIVKGSFVKKYSDNPRTVININPINLNGVTS